MPSSSGALQLAASSGVQDAILYAPASEASMTLFRSVHQRFTSYAADIERVDLSQPTINTTAHVTLPRYGDIIQRLTLEVTLPALERNASMLKQTDNTTDISAGNYGGHYCNAVGYAVFDYVELEIGGVTVEQLYSTQAFIYEELSGPPGKQLYEAVGRVPWREEADYDLIELAKREQKLYVPLPFFFSKYTNGANPTYGFCIPIVALSYHELRFKIKTRSVDDICVSTFKDDSTNKWLLYSGLPVNASTSSTISNTDITIHLLVTYVYLTTPEREATASVAANLIIQPGQQQIISVAANSSTKIENKLFFSHPSTSLMWVYRPNDWNTEAGRRQYSVGHKDFFDFSKKVDPTGTSWPWFTADYPWGRSVDPLTSVSLGLNGHARWPSDMPAQYFRLFTPWDAWNKSPESKFIYAYNFGLSATTHQPTATLNFSRIDNALLGTLYDSTIEAGELIIYNQHCNLLSISGGVSSIRFSS